MEKKVSIRDIASHLGVSTALVSYVLNNKKDRVSPEMTAKIRKAAEELNYRPNLIAKSLKSGRTNTLGLIVADIANPFFSQIARIIEEEAQRAGYIVIFGSNGESVEKSQALTDALLNRQVDALIIAPAEGTEEQIRSLQAKQVPFVLIDRYFSDLVTDSVHINNYEAARTAVGHLALSGYRRIAMLAYETGMQHIAERKRGYLDALKEHGITFRDEWLVQANYHNLDRDVPVVMHKLLKEGNVDAIFFATNTLAVHGMRQVMQMNVKVPDKLAIVSFDETEAFDFFYAPIPFVRQSMEDIGREAVKLALENIAQKRSGQKEVFAGYELKARDGVLSTAIQKQPS